jgi:hypothetical protein
MPQQIKMCLDNPNLQFRQNMASYIHPPIVQAPRPIALNASMIDRIHKAKPGCGACGKKVA